MLHKSEDRRAVTRGTDAFLQYLIIADPFGGGGIENRQGEPEFQHVAAIKKRTRRIGDRYAIHDDRVVFREWTVDDIELVM